MWKTYFQIVAEMSRRPRLYRVNDCHQSIRVPQESNPNVLLKAWTSKKEFLQDIEQTLKDAPSSAPLAAPDGGGGTGGPPKQPRWSEGSSQPSRKR